MPSPLGVLWRFARLPRPGAAVVPEIKAAAAMRVEKIMVIVEDLDLSVPFSCFCARWACF